MDEVFAKKVVFHWVVLYFVLVKGYLGECAHFRLLASELDISELWCI